MTKRILWGLPAMLVLGLGAWLLWPAPRPVRAYERIRLGMTASEVEAVIGEAPSNRVWAITPSIGDFEPFAPFTLGAQIVRRTGVPFRTLGIRFSGEGSGRQRYAADGWVWPEYDIWVIYDLDGEVIGYELIETCLPSRSWFDRVWDWLGSWRGPPTTKMAPAPRSVRAAAE